MRGGYWGFYQKDKSGFPAGRGDGAKNWGHSWRLRWFVGGFFIYFLFLIFYFIILVFFSFMD